EHKLDLLFPVDVVNPEVGFFFFFSSRRRHTRFDCDWSSDVCSSDLSNVVVEPNQTSSQLMGACMQGQQATLYGFVCGRSTDVNEIGRASCRERVDIVVGARLRKEERFMK